MAYYMGDMLGFIRGMEGYQERQEQEEETLQSKTMQEFEAATKKLRHVQQELETLQSKKQERSSEMQYQQRLVLQTKQELEAATKKLEEFLKFIYTEKPHLRSNVPICNCFGSPPPPGSNPPPPPPDDPDKWLVWVIQLLIDYLKFLKNEVLPLVKCVAFCTTICAIISSVCAPCLGLPGILTILGVYTNVMGVLGTTEEILGKLIDTLESLRKSLDGLDGDDDVPFDFVSIINKLTNFLYVISLIHSKQELKAAIKMLEELQKFIYTEKPHLRSNVPICNDFISSPSSPGSNSPPDPPDDPDKWLVWVIQLLIDFLKFLQNEVLPLVKCVAFCTTICAIILSLCAPCLGLPALLPGYTTISGLYKIVIGMLGTTEEILGKLIDTLESMRKSLDGLDGDDDPSDFVSTCNKLAKYLNWISIILERL